ncbi:MAG: DUF4340 domain-containing protein [Bacteroidota bacterium]
MQQKQLIWLGGSLVALLALAFASGTFGREISTVDVPALSISSEQIEHFEIVTSDSSIFTLEKQNGIWHITSPIQDVADSLTVERFTQNLDDIRLESVVSTNVKKYDSYGVGENSKHVNIAWGRNKKTFHVGDSGPDFQSFYLRMGGDSRVFLSSGRLNLPENLDTWRNKLVITLVPEIVNQIAVSTPATTYEVNRNGSVWKVVEDGDESTIESAKIMEWMDRFAPLEATAFINDMPAAEVKAEATHQIHFSMPGGGTQTIWIVDAENELAATVSGKAATFRLSPALLDTFIPDPDDLTDD